MRIARATGENCPRGVSSASFLVRREGARTTPIGVPRWLTRRLRPRRSLLPPPHPPPPSRARSTTRCSSSSRRRPRPAVRRRSWRDEAALLASAALLVSAVCLRASAARALWSTLGGGDAVVARVRQCFVRRTHQRTPGRRLYVRTLERVREEEESAACGRQGGSETRSSSSSDRRRHLP